ncbi:MAG: energy-coupling factor ABC transporter ATP-binding protein [Proteobacteria bacterium]|nr:energy-coupling factor ABC transporter ATP-binding protein [Pseudomonadota bacterium]
MFALENVSHDFGEGPVLTGITVRLAERRIGILGANGSGKSTFARLLNGLVVPREGTVSAFGRSTRSDGKAVRRDVGFVFQNPDSQIVMPTLEEDIAFGLKNLGLPPAEVTSRIEAELNRYDLAAHRSRPVHTLSGGQKQLAALIGVLAMRPRAIVLDEPTTLLDHRNRKRLLAVLAGLEQQVIMVTHDLEALAGFDRVLVFEEGRLFADAAPEDAIARYRALID